VSLFTRGCRVSQVHINRRRGGVKCSVPDFRENFASQIPDPSPLSRETRSAQHSRHRRGGGAGGGGTSSCRSGDGTRTVSRSTARPPSPARPAPPNTVDTVAGEGPGVGEHQVVVPVMTCERFRDRHHVPPLPRDPLRPTQTTLSRGRGRGWGNIRLSFSAMACERFRHRQRDPSSALRAPSPGGGRLRCRSIR